MKAAFCIVILLISISTVYGQNPNPRPAADSINSDSLLNAGLNELLSCLLLNRGDFHFRDDYVDRDTFRLAIVDSLMARPLNMLPFTEICVAHCAGFERNPDAVMTYLSALFGAKRLPGKKNDKAIAGAETLKIPGVSATLERLITALSTQLPDINPFAGVAGGSKEAERKESIEKNYKQLILEDDDLNRTVEQLDSIQKAEDAYAKSFAKLAADLPDIDIAKSACLNCIINLLDTLRQEFGKDSYKKFAGTTITTPRGRIAIGSSGDDTYRGEYYMILDPGGNDSYYLTYDITHPHPTLIADFAGNDFYSAESDFALACGAFSLSLLVDFAGDDIYRGRNFALGAGYFGIGILWDLAGNDNYFSDTFAQGAGTFGLGLLVDSDGADTYTGNLYCQGFGFVRGIGGLIDFSGNDAYIVQPKYTDVLRYDDHYISLSQGFAYGIRPYLSGGFGFLSDFAGNDVYVSDIFGQGSAYWWALGLLYDKSGNDQYISFQYAQGAGAHMALGMLLDDAGNDVYRSHGVSQGCGHDYSCGWLVDRQGEDSYSTESLSQGAGSANGFGIISDLLGNDGYYVINRKNTQGFGDTRRDYGSIGLFLDMDGSDRYDGNGADNFFWRTKSKWGGGLDRHIVRPDAAEIKK